MVRSTIARESEASASAFSCKYKGVRKRKWGKFVSEIRLPNSRERIWLGSYDTPEKAARAFDAALFCLRGRKAKFNFPENPPEITNGMSMSPGDIQEAAARYAHSGDQVPRSLSSSELIPSSHAGSPCPSVSYGAAHEFTNMPLDGSFLDPHVFGVYEEFSGEFFVPPLPNFGSWPDNTEEESTKTSFLWNF